MTLTDMRLTEFMGLTETRKKSFQIILRPDVIIALFLFPRGATKCSSRAMWSPEAGEEETVVSC